VNQLGNGLIEPRGQVDGLRRSGSKEPTLAELMIGDENNDQERNDQPGQRHWSPLLFGTARSARGRLGACPSVETETPIVAGPPLAHALLLLGGSRVEAGAPLLGRTTTVAGASIIFGHQSVSSEATNLTWERKQGVK
jgi:hypothetical protein